MVNVIDNVTVGHIVERGGRNRIGRREKWPKKNLEEGEIGGEKIGRREKKKSKRLGRREKLDQKVGEEGDLPPCSITL